MTRLSNGKWELGPPQSGASYIIKKPAEQWGYGPTVEEYTHRPIDGDYQKFVRTGHKRHTRVDPTDMQIRDRMRCLGQRFMLAESNTPKKVWQDLVNSWQLWVVEDAYRFVDEWTPCPPDPPWSPTASPGDEPMVEPPCG